MKLTFRIPTEIISQVLTEGLGMDTPIEAGEPITVELDVKARELVRIGKGGFEIMEAFDDFLSGATTVDEPDDGTNPITVPMDDQATEEAA
jgi:hypothetical protein